MHTILTKYSGLALVALLPLGSGAYAQPLQDGLQTLTDNRAQPEQAEVSAAPAIENAQDAHASVRVNRALDVGAIAVKGLQTMTPGDFADVIAPCIGTKMDSDALADLADAMVARAHANGFAFATAWIEPQQLRSGVLSVTIDEGRIDEIRVDGGDHAGVRRALAPLISGQPARLAEVERRLLIAGDINGVRVTGSRFIREEGRGVLVVTITRDRISAQATLANEGTRVIGPEQLTLNAEINSLLASDDAVSLTWSATPFQPGELQFGRIRYERRISRTGTEVSMSGSMALTRPGAYLQSLGIESRSWQASLSVLQPLLRRRSRSLWLQTELNLRDLHQTRDGAIARDERVVTARGTVYGYTNLAGGRLRANLSVTRGLGILGASPADNPLASRGDADGTFTTLGLWSDWTGTLSGPVSMRLALQGQIAFDPLPVSEELGLGGTAFLRGYDWFERSGDEGVIGMAELRYSLNKPLAAVRRAQLYAFVDGGSVRNRQNGFGGGALGSTGGGIRAEVTKTFGANLEVAMPLSGIRYDTGDESPKINFRLNKSF